MIGRVVTTEDFFNFVRLNMEGEDYIIVTHGADPRVVKKEVVDQGLEPEQPRSFSISGTIELNSDDDEEKLPMGEMLTREGKSLYESVLGLGLGLGLG